MVAKERDLSLSPVLAKLSWSNIQYKAATVLSNLIVT
jgi:hypothetical protein